MLSLLEVASSNRDIFLFPTTGAVLADSFTKEPEYLTDFNYSERKLVNSYTITESLDTIVSNHLIEKVNGKPRFVWCVGQKSGQVLALSISKSLTQNVRSFLASAPELIDLIIEADGYAINKYYDETYKNEIQAFTEQFNSLSEFTNDQLDEFIKNLHTFVVPTYGDFIESTIYSVSPLVHKDLNLVGKARDVPPKNLPNYLKENYLANRQAIFLPSYLPEYIKKMLEKIKFDFIQFVSTIRSTMNQFFHFEKIHHIPKQHIYAMLKGSLGKSTFFDSLNDSVRDGHDYEKNFKDNNTRVSDLHSPWF